MSLPKQPRHGGAANPSPVETVNTHKKHAAWLFANNCNKRLSVETFLWLPSTEILNPL